jgi:hypothetical protein
MSITMVTKVSGCDLLGMKTSAVLFKDNRNSRLIQNSCCHNNEKSLRAAILKLGSMDTYLGVFELGWEGDYNFFKMNIIL